jgi:hypothetical protein
VPCLPRPGRRRGVPKRARSDGRPASVAAAAGVSEILKAQAESSRVLTVLLAAIASVSLVGGVGIMNSMDALGRHGDVGNHDFRAQGLTSGSPRVSLLAGAVMCAGHINHELSEVSHGRTRALPPSSPT